MGFMQNLADIVKPAVPFVMGGAAISYAAINPPAIYSEVMGGQELNGEAMQIRKSYEEHVKSLPVLVDFMTAQKPNPKRYSGIDEFFNFSENNRPTKAQASVGDISLYNKATEMRLKGEAGDIVVTLMQALDPYKQIRDKGMIMIQGDFPSPTFPPILVIETTGRDGGYRFYDIGVDGSIDGGYFQILGQRKEFLPFQGILYKVYQNTVKSLIEQNNIKPQPKEEPKERRRKTREPIDGIYSG